MSVKKLGRKCKQCGDRFWNGTGDAFYCSWLCSKRATAGKNKVGGVRGKKGNCYSCGVEVYVNDVTSNYSWEKNKCLCKDCYNAKIDAYEEEEVA